MKTCKAGAERAAAAWQLRSTRQGECHALTILVAIMAFVAAAAIQPMQACAQSGTLIREVQVTGNHRIEAETVKHYLTFKAGQRYDAEKADESVKALFATGLFRDVHIKLQGGAVVVEVSEAQLIRRVAFEGAKEVTSETLAKEVQLKTGGYYTSTRASADVQRILSVYRRQGYYAAQVEAKIIEADNNRVDLVFEIREGPETKVAGINFIGNKSFSDAELRGAISSTQSSFLDFLKPTSIYDPDRLNLDRELLHRFYIKNGFADMRIVSAGADVDQDRKGFFLTFVIDEGPRYTFGALDVEVLLKSVNAETLRKRVAGRPGDIYNSELIEKTIEALTVSVADQGESFGQIRARIDRDPKTRTISVFYVVEQGPREYIERIDITGNTVTRDDVIRREFRIAEGDAYNKAMADQAKRRLDKLGFFKSVKIAKEKGSAPGRAVLTVTVEEQQTGEFSFGAGYSSANGVIGDVTYIERNLMGTGQYLQVKLDGSLSGAEGLTVSWTEPRFLDYNLSFGVDAFIKNSDYTQSSGYTVAGYEDFRVGGSLRVGVPLTDEVSVGFNYTLMLDDVYNLDPNASLAVKEIQGSAIISSIGYNVLYDSRNNKKKPTEGLYIKGTQDLAGVGGDVDYIRSTAEIRGYYPVSDDITLAARTMAGTIMGWGGQNVRVVDAFYRGGETIPGFQSAGLGPRDAATGDALGATTFYSATAELRFPLPFVPQDLGLSGAIYTAAGSAFGTDAQKFSTAYVAQHGGTNTLVVQDSSVIRSAAGGSLVWDSPIGPLRADFSDVLTKAPFDKTQVMGFGYSPW
jgi:outer membrane protein insertion porin family